MSGRILGILVIAIGLFSGVAIYWLQLYAFYEDLGDKSSLKVTWRGEAAATSFEHEGFQGIDATSSPLRFRACFQDLTGGELWQDKGISYPDPTPLTAPHWFDCFDAVDIGTALEAGRAHAYLSEKNIHDGVDRVIAIFPDGRGFAWHQLNEKYSEK